MRKIIGSFVFVNEGSGRLKSTFRNNGTDQPQIETCQITNKSSDLNGFAGTYNSIWNEEDGNATLEIVQVDNSKFYNFTWTNTETNLPKFFGQGMLFEKILVGCYWNTQLAQFIQTL
ncbi:MAG: hypothetical protein QM535_21365 [Limnohabitans sp.]|nr:hypothetical protein [Limnohabitans sp.]